MDEVDTVETGDVTEAIGEQPGAEDTNALREARKHIKQLEKETKELRAAERKRVFSDAGFPIEEGSPGVLLDKTYEGELSVDAVQAFAESAGLTASTASAPTNSEVIQEIAASQKRTDAVMAASVAVGAGATDLRQQIIDTERAASAATNPEEEQALWNESLRLKAVAAQRQWDNFKKSQRAQIGRLDQE
jgi:hypothetical protein